MIDPSPLRGQTEDAWMTSVVGEWRMEKDHLYVYTPKNTHPAQSFSIMLCNTTQRSRIFPRLLPLRCKPTPPVVHLPSLETTQASQRHPNQERKHVHTQAHKSETRNHKNEELGGCWPGQPAELPFWTRFCPTKFSRRS